MICGRQGLRTYKYRDNQKDKYIQRLIQEQPTDLTYDVIRFWKGDDKRSLIMQNLQNMANMQNMQNT